MVKLPSKTRREAGQGNWTMRLSVILHRQPRPGSVKTSATRGRGWSELVLDRRRPESAAAPFAYGWLAP